MHINSLVPYKLAQIVKIIIKQKKMNFEIFATALFVMATADSAGQDSDLAEALNTTYQDAPVYVQRR